MTAISFDAWLCLPGLPIDSIFYARPSSHAAPGSAPSDDDGFDLPSSVLGKVLFSITAHNPRGVNRDDETNRISNIWLRNDLDTTLVNPSPLFICPSFGFSADWREDGFLVAFEIEQLDAARDQLLRLATKYDQGAIYMCGSFLDDGK